MPNTPERRSGESRAGDEQLRLRALGGFSGESDGEALTWLFTHRRAGALLLYLAVEREATRDVLLALLWPEQDADRGRHSLSQMLYRLRQHLGEDWLEVHGDQLRVSARITVDACTVADAIERRAWGEALAVYRGPFLSGVYLAGGAEFEEWVERQRTRLERLHRRARREFASERVAAGDREGALETAREWVDLNPLEDEAQRLLMSVLAEAGERTEALSQYAEYRHLLAAEEMEPLEETSALAERIRTGELAPSVSDKRASTAGVAMLGDSAAEAGRAAAVAQSSVSPPWIAAAAAVLLVTVLIGVFGDNSLGSLLSAEGEAGTFGVAVLPINHPSLDSADQYLADGLTEDLTTALGRVQRLQVKGPTAVRRVLESDRGDPSTIARALGVRYLFDASLRRTARGLRVSARVVERASETQVWSNSYDATTASLLELPSLIAREVGTALTGGLSRDETAAAGRRPTENPDAHLAFWRGNYFLALRTPQAADSAHGHYTRALQHDPGFVGALARDAHVYVQRLDYSWIPEGATAASLLERALAMIDRALARDSASAESWTARAYALAHAGRLVAAREAAERAVLLDPASVEAQARLGWILMHFGDYTAVTRQGRQVLALDPWFYIGYRLLGEAAFFRGRNSEALAMLDSAVHLSPGDAASRHWRARVRIAAGDLTGARADANEWDRLIDTVTWLSAYARAKGGESAAARRWLQDAAEVRGGPADGDARLGLALLWLALGERAAAIDVLERTPPEATASWSYTLKAPEFAPLSDDRRFQHVIEGVRSRNMVR